MDAHHYWNYLWQLIQLDVHVQNLSSELISKGDGLLLEFATILHVIQMKYTTTDDTHEGP